MSESLKQVLTEMAAVPRKDWKERFESRLMGAFGEYVAGQIAEQFDLHNAWSSEVQRLANVANRYFNKTIAFKNLRRAYDEVIEDCDPDVKVNYAKKHVIGYYKNLRVPIMELELDGQELFQAFLARYIKNR